MWWLVCAARIKCLSPIVAEHTITWTSETSPHWWSEGWTAERGAVTRGEVLQNQQPHDCNGFMLVFKPTNDRDQNVFLQPFTDVKIQSESHPLKYMEARQRRGMWRKNRGEKRNIFFIFWPKGTRMQPVCVTDQQKRYLEPEACGLGGVLSKMIPLWKLEKVKIFTEKRRISCFQRDRSLMWFLICGKCKWWFLCHACNSILLLCKRTQLSVSLKLSLQLSRGRVGEEELFTAALFWLVSNNIEIVRGIAAAAQGK